MYNGNKKAKVIEHGIIENKERQMATDEDGCK